MPWNKGHLLSEGVLIAVFRVDHRPDCFLEADVVQSVGARPSGLEGHQFYPRHSIDVCFDFPLFHVAAALNTRKTEH